MISLLSLSLLASNIAAGSELIISNADEFVKFSNSVNSGERYTGTTILLGADIDLSGEDLIAPIGNAYPNYLNGTFNGQGHTVSNFKMESSSAYVGLFGHSRGTTVKNVILDSTCSIWSSPNDRYYGYVGGIIGGCSSNENDCVVSNSVSMASITFNGHLKYNLYIGGVAGEFKHENFETTVKNCANYGAITYETDGYTSYDASIGGIIGYSGRNVLNCVNYGNIVATESPGCLYMGGIAGVASETNIENCVSIGNIEANDKLAKVYVGSIAGSTYLSSSILNCYWSTNTYEEAIGGGYSHLVSNYVTSKYVTAFDDDFVLNESVSAGTYEGVSLIAALNAYADRHVLDDYSSWALLNDDMENVSFAINGDEDGFMLESQLVLLPSLAAEGKRWFDGWYTDSACTTPLASFESVAATVLYGKFGESAKEFTITFVDDNGVYVGSFKGAFGTAVKFPANLTKERYEFFFWATEAGETVPWNFTVLNRDMTLRPTWVVVRISTASELIELSNSVNSGVYDYAGKTVALNNDIVFTDKLSELFEPIGWKDGSDSQYFKGVFDGQGFSIKGLKLRGEGYVGLFGYSLGITIRNLVMDSSCSYVGQQDYSTVYIGGIIGYCGYGSNAPCTIKNCVNKMDITYNANKGHIYLGGVVGYINGYYNWAYKIRSIITNCANRGNIKVNSDGPYTFVSMGGITGHASVIDANSCTNYGDVTFEGVSGQYLFTGGIVGDKNDCSIKKCKNHGYVTDDGSVKIDNNKRTVLWVVIGVVALVAVVGIAVGVYVVIRRRRGKKAVPYMVVGLEQESTSKRNEKQECTV